MCKIHLIKTNHNSYDIMSILELRKIVLAVLLALALAPMFLACSSTKESPTPEETGSGSGPCDCLVGDIECSEQCLQDLPI